MKLAPLNTSSVDDDMVTIKKEKEPEIDEIKVVP